MSDLTGLLARRLCHDIAGPAGAINTAIELLGSDDDGDIRALLADSAAALIAGLKLYRYICGGDAGDFRACLASWAATREGMALGWVEPVAVDEPRAALLVGLAMTAAEAGMGAATMTVGEHGVTLTAARIALDHQIAAALEGHRPATPRAALAAFLHGRAAEQGLAVRVEATPATLRLTLYQGSALPR